jgi:hypothetical protein
MKLHDMVHKPFTMYSKTYSEKETKHFSTVLLQDEKKIIPELPNHTYPSNASTQMGVKFK